MSKCFELWTQFLYSAPTTYLYLLVIVVVNCCFVTSNDGIYCYYNSCPLNDGINVMVECQFRGLQNVIDPLHPGLFNYWYHVYHACLS
jgi:hypothetical protein